MSVFLERFLSRHLRHILEEDYELDVQTSLLAQKVTVRDARVRVDRLGASLFPPFVPKLLHVGLAELRADVLNASLSLSKPICLSLTDVFVLLEAMPAGAQETGLPLPDPAEVMKALISEIELGYQLWIMRMEGVESLGEVSVHPATLDKLKRALQSLEVTVGAVHIRVEDGGYGAQQGLPRSPSPFAAGLVLQEMRLVGDGEDFEAFQREAGDLLGEPDYCALGVAALERPDDVVVRKVVSLRGLRVYCQEGADPVDVVTADAATAALSLSLSSQVLGLTTGLGLSLVLGAVRVNLLPRHFEHMLRWFNLISRHRPALRRLAALSTSARGRWRYAVHAIKRQRADRCTNRWVRWFREWVQAARYMALLEELGRKKKKNKETSSAFPSSLPWQLPVGDLACALRRMHRSCGAGRTQASEEELAALRALALEMEIWCDPNLLIATRVLHHVRRRDRAREQVVERERQRKSERLRQTSEWSDDDSTSITVSSASVGAGASLVEEEEEGGVQHEEEGEEASLASQVDRVGTLLVKVVEAKAVRSSPTSARVHLSIEESSAAAEQEETATTGRSTFDPAVGAWCWAHEPFLFHVELDPAHAQELEMDRAPGSTSCHRSGFLLTVAVTERRRVGVLKKSKQLGSMTLSGNQLTAAPSQICEHLLPLGDEEGLAVQLLTCFVPPGGNTLEAQRFLMQRHLQIDQQRQQQAHHHQLGHVQQDVLDANDFFAVDDKSGIRTVAHLAVARGQPLWLATLPRSVCLAVRCAPSVVCSPLLDLLALDAEVRLDAALEKGTGRLAIVVNTLHLVDHQRSEALDVRVGPVTCEVEAFPQHEECWGAQSERPSHSEDLALWSTTNFYHSASLSWGSGCALHLEPTAKGAGAGGTKGTPELQIGREEHDENFAFALLRWMKDGAQIMLRWPSPMTATTTLPQ
jgi:hypothetical protein